MSDLGSTWSSARTASGKAVSAAGKALNTGKRAYRLGGRFLLHVAIFIMVGFLLGALSLLEPFGAAGIHVPSLMLVITAAGAALAGVAHAAWVARQGDGQRRFWPEFGMAALVTLGLGLGILLGHVLLPDLGSGSKVFAWTALAAAPMLLMPTLLWWCFGAALAYEPKRYELWFYAKHYREQQPTWNKDRVVIANLHFKRKANEELLTTVNARLPEEALLGELVYLFIKDYNENRFPNDPIKDLRRDDGSLGWLFKRKRFVFKKQRRWAWSSRVLDPTLTVAQNGITRDTDVYLERMIETPVGDE